MSKAQFLKDNLKPGEVYAGLILGQNGEKDYHLILLPQTVPSTTWQKAKLYLFIVDFEGDMRRLLRQAQERRFGHAAKPGGARANPDATEEQENETSAPGAEADSDTIGDEEEKPAEG